MNLRFNTISDMSQRGSGGADMDFSIKSNELNTKSKEQIKSVLKREDYVDAFIQLYEETLKVLPHALIRGETDEIVGVSIPDERYLYYVANNKNTGLQIKFLDLSSSAFSLEVIQDFQRHAIEQAHDRMWNPDRYKLQKKQDKGAEKRTNSEKTAATSPVIDSHSNKKGSLKDLLNKQVTHKTFKRGKITSLHDQTVKVFFEGGVGEKTFVFPDAFGSFLKFTDPTLQERVSELINKNSVPVTSSQKEVKKPQVYTGSISTGTQKQTPPTAPKSIVNYTGQNLPSSAIMLAEIASVNDKYNVVIVEKQVEQKTAEGIYWKNRDLSKLITNAHFTGEKKFRFKEKDYEILSVKQGSRYSAFKTEWNKFNDTTHSKDLIIYKQKGILEKNKDKYELVDVQLYFPAKFQAIKVTMYYESPTGQFYMNEESFLPLIKAYGMPNITVHVKKSDSEPISDMSGFSEESKLKMLGYNVQADGMSSAERHNLLDYLIRSGQITDAEVTSHLEWAIRFNKGKPNMANACSRWREDVNFVYDHFGDIRRKYEFYGSSGNSKIGPGQKKSLNTKKSKRQIQREQEKRRLTQRKKELIADLAKATGILNTFKRARLKKELSELEDRLSRI